MKTVVTPKKTRERNHLRAKLEKICAFTTRGNSALFWSTSNGHDSPTVSNGSENLTQRIISRQKGAAVSVFEGVVWPTLCPMRDGHFQSPSSKNIRFKNQLGLCRLKNLSLI